MINNPESPSANALASELAVVSVAFSADGILGQAISPPDLLRGCSSDSTVSWGSAYSNTPTTLCPATAAVVAQTRDEMGLNNPSTTPFHKLNSIDKCFIEDLLLVEEGRSSTRRYTGINNTCQLAMKRLGMDLSRNVADAETLQLTIAEEKLVQEELEVELAQLRDAYHEKLNEVAEQKASRESNVDLYHERVNDGGPLRKKYVVSQWIKANPETLASATVGEARSFIGLDSMAKVRLLGFRASMKKLRLLKRLGWHKSMFMVRAFGGALLIKPREGTVKMSHDLLIAYLRLASDTEMHRAVHILHKENIQRNNPAPAAELSAILEDEEGDDPATTAKKRQVREMVEELMSPSKKRRTD